MERPEDAGGSPVALRPSLQHSAWAKEGGLSGEQHQ